MPISTFRPAVVRTPNGPDSIDIIEVPVTEPGPGQVRVTVAGAAVNPVDLAIANGVFRTIGAVQQPKHTGLGWDFAGTIVAVGTGVDLALGTRVAGLVAGVDRDFGTYAEQLVVPVTDTAVVPDDLDLIAAATVPLNGQTAAQIVELLGDAPAGKNGLLVAGAAGAVGGYVLTLARQRGWRVTGLARAEDEKFVRDFGADFSTEVTPGWDAVADTATLQEAARELVRDGGTYVGVLPNAAPSPARGIRIESVMAHADGAQLAELPTRTESGELPARVHSVVSLDRVADAHKAVAKGGIRGRYVITP